MYGGKKLRQLRQHLGYNQDEFAGELNISQPYYSAIESGKKQISEKIFDAISLKWKIQKEYFENPEINIHDYLTSKGNNRGEIGGVLGSSIGGSLGKISGIDIQVDEKNKMTFLYKAIFDLNKTNPELMKYHYNLSELSALLVDVETIYQTYIDSALNHNIQASTYDEYKEKLIKHLEGYLKYEKEISPVLSALNTFVSSFKKHDTKKVINHDGQ